MNTKTLLTMLCNECTILNNNFFATKIMPSLFYTFYDPRQPHQNCTSRHRVRHGPPLTTIEDHSSLLFPNDRLGGIIEYRYVNHKTGDWMLVVLWIICICVHTTLASPHLSVDIMGCSPRISSIIVIWLIWWYDGYDDMVIWWYVEGVLYILYIIILYIL